MATDVRSLLDNYAREVSASHDAMEAMLLRGRGRRRRERVLAAAVALLVAVGGLAGAVIAFHQPGAARPADTGNPQPTAPVHPTATGKAAGTMTVTVDGATFTVSGSPSPDGYCLIVSGDGGSLGGCGSSNGPFRFGEGGLRVAGQLYNVAYGRVPDGASSMEAVLGDGSSMSEDASNGVWLFVVATREGDRTTDIAVVRAKDVAGDVISKVRLPSLAAARNGASRHKYAPVHVGYVPNSYAYQGRSKNEVPGNAGLLQEFYFNNLRVPATFEVDVGQGSDFLHVGKAPSQPGARHVTVNGHPAWLVPPSALSGLTYVEWIERPGLAVRVAGRSVPETVLIAVANSVTVGAST
jgi:hypothetical protein